LFNQFLAGLVVFQEVGQGAVRRALSLVCCGRFLRMAALRQQGGQQYKGGHQLSEKMSDQNVVGRTRSHSAGFPFLDVQLKKHVA
jgi:hypothetical protein